jgi:hypothetical protein
MPYLCHIMGYGGHNETTKRKDRHGMKITKAERLAKSRAMPVNPIGNLSTSWNGWNGSSYESLRRASGRYHKSRDRHMTVKGNAPMATK